MKLKSTLLAATLAAFAASTVYAADDAMTKKADAPTAEKAEVKEACKETQSYRGKGYTGSRIQGRQEPSRNHG